MTNSSLRTVLVFLVCLVMLTSVAPPCVRADEADSDFTFAAGFYRKNRWQYSADAFKKFLEDYPNHARVPMARLYYGLSLNSLEKYAESRKQLQAFVKADPDNRYAADAKYRIAEDSYYLQESEQAVTQLQAYLTDHPGHSLNAWARLLLGESQNRLKKFAEAEAALRPLVALPPPANILADGTYALAEALQGQNKLEEAEDFYEQVAEMKSVNFSHKSLFRIAGIRYDNNDFVKAAATYDRIVAEYSDKPMAATAAFQSGVARFRMKQFEEAYVRFDRVPADSSEARYTGLWKGLCLRDAGRYEDARKEFVKALSDAGDSPLAAQVMFHRAQLEVLDSQKEVAAQMYLDLTERWPQDASVAQSLFNAAELQMETRQVPGAMRTLTRLETDFPERARSADVMVLRGRLLLNDGKPDEAVTVLQSAVAIEGGSPGEQLSRNYHLIRALHRAKKFDEAVNVFEPLKQAFGRPEANSYFGAISLAAVSCLELKEYAKAEQYADQFLQLEIRPDNMADALATRAVATSHLKEFQKARDDLDKLTSDFPENAQTWMAVLQSAEAAWHQENYPQAASLFELAATRKDKRSLQAALSGAGWSYYRLNNFEKSNAIFARISTEFPDATEAIYMEALGLFKSGDAPAATQKFTALFEKLGNLPAAAQNPASVPYFLESGRMSARILGEEGRVDEANTMWASLSKTFESSEQLDTLLNEWAELNLVNERYDQSDEIYRKLVDRFPQSKFAGAARLSLAESDMQANRLAVALKEFTSIATDDSYAAAEREAAMFHVIDIHAAQREWPEVIRFSEVFATDYGASENAPMVQLLYAEGLLDEKRYRECREKLDTLRAAVLNKSFPAAEWTERVWVVLAELALAEKRYSEIDTVAEELEQRVPRSRFLFQLRYVQARRWKAQAPPDFPKSRDYSLQVIQDPIAKGTETAARCQFLIAETLLMEENLASAAREYHRVYHVYAFDELRVSALYQAARCEMNLNQIAEATRSFEDLINEFPASDLAFKAKERLAELAASKK